MELNLIQVEALWPIFKIHHQKSRYLYDLYYKRKAISKELYDYCIKEKIADANLIAKWKKDGYERLCCLRCIQVIPYFWLLESFPRNLLVPMTVFPE